MACARGRPPRNRIAALIFPNLKNPDGSLNHWNIQQSVLIITMLAYLVLKECRKQVKEREEAEKEGSSKNGD